jgi:hypothetical protein
MGAGSLYRQAARATRVPGGLDLKFRSTFCTARFPERAEFGSPGRIRTDDPLLTRQPLWPTELRREWQRGKDLNPQPLTLEDSALPIELPRFRSLAFHELNLEKLACALECFPEQRRFVREPLLMSGRLAKCEHPGFFLE